MLNLTQIIVENNTIRQMQIQCHADEKKEETNGEGDDVGLEWQIRIVDGVREAVGMEWDDRFDRKIYTNQTFKRKTTQIF